MKNPSGNNRLSQKEPPLQCSTAIPNPPLSLSPYITLARFVFLSRFPLPSLHTARSDLARSSCAINKPGWDGMGTTMGRKEGRGLTRSRLYIAVR